MPKATPQDIREHQTKQASRQRPSSRKPPTEAVDPAKMWAIGAEIKLGTPKIVAESVGARTYEIAAFRVVDLWKAYALLDMLPMVLRVHVATAAENGGVYSSERTAERLRSLSAIASKKRQAVDGMLRPVLEAANADAAAKGEEAIPFPEMSPNGIEDMITADVVELSIQSGEDMTEDACEAMVDLATLAIGRRRPGITREEIEPDLDLDAMMRILQVIYTLNDGLRKRF